MIHLPGCYGNILPGYQDACSQSVRTYFPVCDNTCSLCVRVHFSVCQGAHSIFATVTLSRHVISSFFIEVHFHDLPGYDFLSFTRYMLAVCQGSLVCQNSFSVRQDTSHFCVCLRSLHMYLHDILGIR